MPVNADFKQGKKMAQPEPGGEKWVGQRKTCSGNSGGTAVYEWVTVSSV